MRLSTAGQPGSGVARPQRFRGRRCLREGQVEAKASGAGPGLALAGTVDAVSINTAYESGLLVFWEPVT